MTLKSLYIALFLSFLFVPYVQSQQTRAAEETGTIVVNELQASNIDMFVDPSFNYGTWIELYNPGEKDVNMNGWYISDNPENLKQHALAYKVGTVKAKGYKVIWFDHYDSQYSPTQVDSKLDADGGTIYISNNKGELVCSQTYPETISRTSFARKEDGSETWGVTSRPTPGKSNAESVFATERLDPPVVDKDGGLFTSSFTLNVSIPQGATLRYTTDGTTPTENHGTVSTSGRFSVSSTRIFRFRLFQEGYLPSRVVTRSYIYADREYNLPIVSVVTDPVNLYDDSLGIFVEGVNGRPGNGMDTPANWNMEWDRPVNFEYYTLDGEAAINQEANMEMCGGWSRMWLPHSFKVKANKIFDGENYFSYQVFPNKAYHKHRTFQLRNGGNDNNSRIKDPALQTIVHSSGLEVDGQECQPVVHFINGEFNGVLNIREPNNKHFVEANYALDEEEIDMFEMSANGYGQMCGTDESLKTLSSLASLATSATVYEKICNILDIDEFINYMAVELYLGSDDWPHNNLKAFKPRRDGGKFRFILYDLDHSFNQTENTFPVFEEKKNSVEVAAIFLNLLRNADFRKQFIDSFCLVAGSVFTPERCNAIIDSMARSTELVLGYEGKSPWWTADDMKSRLSNRQGQMISALKNYSNMKLSGVSSRKVKMSANIPQARLLVNNLPVPTNRFDGTLFDPITLKTEAPAGYKFEGWKLVKTSKDGLIGTGGTWYYYDKGSLDGKDWKSSVTSGWSSGKAPLGYYTGDTNNSRGYNTILDYGGNDNDKRRTYYFCKEFTLKHTPLSSDVYTFMFRVDDGMVIYINGKEATRYLMPGGTVKYETFATTHASGNPDEGSVELPSHLFKEGKNVIAVEVHNNSSSSSDIFFDAALIVNRMLTDENIANTDETFTLPADVNENLTIQACYTPIVEDEMESAHAVPVRINEISADNSIYVSATYFKKNDWIELYNTTSKPMDVAGMYLTDNLEKPLKYQIPSSETINTVIPPYGYLVLWADKLESVHQLHTQFKLENEGGLVMLTSADQAWSDTLFYPSHYGFESVGLYPDGGMNTYVMNVPTIAATNQWSSYVQYIVESELPASIPSVESHTEHLCRAAWLDGRLHIWATFEGDVVVDVFQTSGLHLNHSIVSLTDGRGSMSLPDLAAGIYIVRIQDAQGRTYSQKLVLK